MRAVIQRVSTGKVTVDGEITGQISDGMVILLGVGQDDTRDDLIYLAEKILGLRIFKDNEDKMNLSIQDIGGSMLIVSQFTLFGDCRKGRRPSYSSAASPAMAQILYDDFVQYMKTKGIQFATGVFQATMLVEIHNDGPVTLLVDSKKAF